VSKLDWKYIAKQLEHFPGQWSFIKKSEAWSGVQSARSAGLEAEIRAGEGLFVRWPASVDTLDTAERPSHALLETQRVLHDRMVEQHVEELQVRYEAAKQFLDNVGLEGRHVTHADHWAIAHALGVDKS